MHCKLALVWEQTSETANEVLPVHNKRLWKEACLYHEKDLLTKAFPKKQLVCLSPVFIKLVKEPPTKKEETKKRMLLITSVENI